MHETRNDHSGLRIIRFRSATEVLEIAGSDNPCTNPANESKRTYYREKIATMPVWVGGMTNRESSRKVWGNPNPAHLNAIDEMRDRIGEDLEIPAKRKRRKLYRNQEDGDELNADGLARGTIGWDCIRPDPIRRDHRGIVTILCQLGGNTGERGSDVLWRGAAAYALTDALESTGNRVEIIGIGHTVHTYLTGPRRMLNVVPIKSADAIMDRSQIVNVLCNLGFYRYGVMQTYFHSDDKVESYGMGRAIPFDGTTDAWMAEQGYDHVIKLDKMICDKHSAEQWVTNNLTRKQEK